MISNGAVELSHLVKHAFPDKWHTLKGLFALRDQTRKHLERKLLKDEVRTSKWSVMPLSARQLEYGACDTYASLELLCLYLRELRDRRQADLQGSENATAAVEAYMQKTIRSCAVNMQASPADQVPAAQTRPATDSAPATTAAAAAATAVLAESLRGGNAAPAFFTHSYQRAFSMWYSEKKSVAAIGAEMRTKENPLKDSTVVGYVLRAFEESGPEAIEEETRARLTEDLQPEHMAFVKSKYRGFLQKHKVIPPPEPIEVFDSSVDLSR